MSEYWKSTPKYWCKHCSVYVRDTKLERANHEATGRHQGALKRSLRDLHRSADQAEREKDRAKREVERLNGVVSGQPSAPRPKSGTYGAPSSSSAAPAGGQLTKEERQRQLEQLVEMGVNIPTELRPEMAMAGEWSVTNTRVIDDDAITQENNGEGGIIKGSESRAVGVKRERQRTEEEKEQEEALNGLFTKRRKWGVDSKRMPGEEDAELDALLSGPLIKTKKEEKTEDEEGMKEEEADTTVKTEVPQDDVPRIKTEESVEGPGLGAITDVKDEVVKKEAGDGVDLSAPDAGDSNVKGTAAVAEGPAVVFKKRKPKNLRQK
ncbi:WW domain-binding protein 4 [Podospora australis]|uniref:WW domain-binding protein 4 n=1 Tax=Podospora australis TaxID=1536484 RepID=A0AAN6WLM8_9PEZI|nr:WW domain-binding protein 4 [Podospora australis]